MDYKLFHINLSSKEVKKINIHPSILKDYLGGRGLGVRLFFDFAKPEIDPFDEKSPIFFLTGPLTGSSGLLTGRFHCVFKSPLTGTIFDSSCGGYAGLHLKRNGIDGIVITGKIAKPSLIYIEGEKIKIESAENLIQLKISDRVKEVKKIYGDAVSYIMCGPSAERGILFSNLISDGRFFGRGGGGCLFNSKNLVAIIVKKVDKVNFEPIDRERFKYINDEIDKWLYGNPITSQGLPEFGTSVLMNLINELNLLPHKNFKEMHFKEADKISGEALKERVIKRRACYSCKVACGRITKSGEGPEYETLWALGANLGISDLDAVIEFNRLCAEYGVDTISLGGSISAYMELNSLPFGDKNLVFRLINKTLEAEDEGKDISLGSKRLAEKFGRKEVSMTVKGLELPAYHPKGIYGMALAYGTSNRGGCHLRAYMLAPEVLGIPKLINRKLSKGKAGIVIYLQNSHAVCDSAIYCRFLGIAVTDDYLSRLLNAFMGWDLTTVDYQRIGERIYNLERIFNIRAGFDKKDDFLPQRLTFDEYESMLNEYYIARGWNEKGEPQYKKLKELDLSWLLE
ncbi:MAG: aldehyde ferredoxin oxidoreductase family protein [Proteobacteria bacterium]|nr:aldehyde ferredoxin oxidoreductase family protein [Pseudomonadota bacterium]